MNPRSSVLLAVVLILSAAVSRAMPADSVEALTQKLASNAQAREVAGEHLQTFLLQPIGGKSFVAADADRAALGAVARAWGAQAKASDLAVLLLVSTPQSKTEVRLKNSLKRWTESAQIQKTKEKAATAAFFADAAQNALTIFSDTSARGEIEEAISANEGTGAALPGGPAATERARRLREKGAGSAAIFDRREAQNIEGNGGSAMEGLKAAAGARPRGDNRRSPEEMAALIADLNAAHRAGRGEPKRPAIGTNEPPPLGDPAPMGPDAGPGEFQALGSVVVAPAPGVLDRAASLAAKDAPTIAADLKNIRDTLKDAELPTVAGNTESNPESIKQFFEWLRNAGDGDMPTIDYTTLSKGEIGTYAPGLALSKGDLKVNHFIRNEPAHLRASVVVHELYHHWDKKVAVNTYPNMSYANYIDPASKHIHEYDAYLATALYWQMVKKEGDSSPLAKVLDRIPTDPTQVKDMVNEALGGRK